MDFSVFKISASALGSQKKRIDVISANLANINTTRTAEGGPYRRRDVVFKSAEIGGFEERLRSAMGVEVTRVVKDPRPPRLVYDPGHPDADENGYVAMPNINLMKEMVNLMLASRSFEANVTAMGAAKSMFTKALEIGR